MGLEASFSLTVVYMGDGRFLVGGGFSLTVVYMDDGRFLVGGLQSDCGIWMMIKVMPAGAVVVRK